MPPKKKRVCIFKCKKLKHQIFQIWFLIQQDISAVCLISQLTALFLSTIFTFDINHNEIFQCLISSLYMQRHYLGLFRHAKSMLMAGHPVCDALFILYARRHLGKSQGRKMKVRGIANIHPRQLFMNIKEQLWMAAGSHHFLLIISKHWNTLQLNGFIPRKVCDYHSPAAIKVKLNNIDSCKEPLLSQRGETRSLYFIIFPHNIQV